MSGVNLDEFVDLTALSAEIGTRSVSPVEVVETALSRIDRLNADLKLYITVLADESLRAARKAEQDIVDGHYLGPLHGVPISVKDLFWTKGIRTTCGSRVLRDFVPDEDAAVPAKFDAAGAILIGKANMKEFASAPAHPDYGQTPNPWDRTRTASGSSGGSVAAVIAGTDFASVGSDTGGSIRVPASFCGAAGFKPSFGLISRYGMDPLSTSLDHAGPITRSARDLAIVMDTLVGYDPRDPASVVPPSGSFVAALADSNEHRQPPVIGVLVDLFDGVEDRVRDAVTAASAELAATGMTVKEIRIPALRNDVLTAHHTLVWVEASYHHRERLQQSRDLYTPTLLKRLGEGGQITGANYLAALETRAALRRQLDAAFFENRVDLFLLPTVPCPASPLDQPTLASPGRESDVAYLMIRTAPFNLTGHPALSIPCGFSPEGWPIGVELVGRYFHDADVIRVADAYQQRTDWHLRRPS